MKRIVRLASCALALALITPLALAQEPETGPSGEEQAAMMAAWQKAMTPGEAHADLARGAGTWKMTIRMWMDPAGEPMVSEGKSERKMILGGRVLAESTASIMMGTEFHGRARIGYDNVTGKYWSTWIDNMSTGCYLQHGAADAEGDSVTFHGEYPDPMTGGTVSVRSVMRWEGDDTQQYEWYEDRGDGEVKTMVITYERTSS